MDREDGDADVVDVGVAEALTSVIVRGTGCVDVVLETSILQSNHDHMYRLDTRKLLRLTHVYIILSSNMSALVSLCPTSMRIVCVVPESSPVWLKTVWL